MRELFKPGQSGNPAGRPVGAKSKVKTDAKAICTELGCDPIKILAWTAMGDEESLNLKGGMAQTLTARLRMEAAAELAQYIVPKLKSIEVKGDQESPFTITINTKKCNCQTQNNSLPKLEDVDHDLLAG